MTHDERLQVLLATPVDWKVRAEDLRLLLAAERAAHEKTRAQVVRLRDALDRYEWCAECGKVYNPRCETCQVKHAALADTAPPPQEEPPK